jgi:hypothetical protein
MFYYDGTPTGKPKPVVYATRFLAEHIVAVGDAVWTDAEAHSLVFSMQTPSAHQENGITASYIFKGPGCYFVAGSPVRSPAVNATVDGSRASDSTTTLVMLSWAPNTEGSAGSRNLSHHLGGHNNSIRAMATEDSVVTLDYDRLLGFTMKSREYASATSLEVISGVHGGVFNHDGSEPSGKGTITATVTIMLLKGEVVMLQPNSNNNNKSS